MCSWLLAIPAYRAPGLSQTHSLPLTWVQPSLLWAWGTSSFNHRSQMKPMETPLLNKQWCPPSPPTSYVLSHGSSHPHAPLHICNHLSTFGNIITCNKSKDFIHIAFSNIGGFPILNEHNNKVQSIKNFMPTYNADVFGGCKSNVNWPLLPDQSQLFAVVQRC